MNLKALRQSRADNDAKQAALKAEGRKLSAVKAADRTAEQVARLDAIDAELETLTAEAATIANDLARAERYAEDERKQPAVITVGQNRAELEPWGPVVDAQASEEVRAEARHIALGTFAQAVRAASMGMSSDPRLFAVAQGAGTQVDSNLGFAVPQEVAAGIEREMFSVGDLLSRVDARSITGNSIAYNVFDETSRADSSRGGGILGYWVDEGEAPTATSMKLARIEMKLRKVGALGYMTDELLEDAQGLGGELERGFADELIFQVENKIYRGNGANAPRGFLNATCLVSVAKETNQAAATINVTNLSKMWARMPARSQKNAVWLVNVDCQPQLDQLALAVGTSALQPRFVNYGPDGILNIKGRPVIAVEYAETVGTQGDIALVDLKKYRLIRKGGVQQASSMHVRFTTGEQTFRAFYRVDGQPVPRAALTPFKGSATLSPFIVLDTRS